MKYPLEVVTTLRDESVTVHFNYYPGSRETRDDPGDDAEVEITAVVRDDGTRMLHLCSEADCKKLEDACYEGAVDLMIEMREDDAAEHAYYEELERGYAKDRL